MCWWRAKAVCALGIVLVMSAAQSTRGESILQVDQHSKAKTAAKMPAIAVNDDSDFDSYAHFLLAGKKKEQPLHLVESKKKSPEPPLHLDQKNAKKLNLKNLKLHKKPVKIEPPKPVSVQFALVPTPMAPSAIEVTGAPAVPAPKSLWAGLAIIAALGISRWFSARRAVGI